MDAWLREAEEASQWVEDLESRINHTSLSVSVSVVNSARSKLLELGVKLDRLESLLRNPPTKPILTHEDLDFRWTMLSDIQLRTRTLARSLYALPCPNRPRNVSATGSKEYNVSPEFYDQDQLQTSYSQGQSELLKPLLQSDDANRSQVEVQPFSFMSRISLWKACFAIFMFVGLAALLFVVILLSTAI
ncbi:uncharacterized protein LOC133286960 isoform X2 [Gastrolobium bilobum]|uniref:uncharacterized protein LOC133286960 isoform X2 n=1 Tax=Gastrolobium bilobum TaxID=150636 RepID=UPI002AB04801|nr:uncharacterized protein LOC133286960 isoform X2 [Gastrolobium bilobum]